MTIVEHAEIEDLPLRHDGPFAHPAGKPLDSLGCTDRGLLWEVQRAQRKAGHLWPCVAFKFEDLEATGESWIDPTAGRDTDDDLRRGRPHGTDEGRGLGRAANHPELLLNRYDLVFAKAKASMEAMAVGAPVVLCDFGGLGPMVRADEFERLRSLNFGFEAFVNELTPEGVIREMERYDTIDAARVRDLVRATCGLEDAVTDLVNVYRQVIEECPPSRARGTCAARVPGQRRMAALNYRVSKVPIVAFYKAFGMGPRRIPGPLSPLYSVAKAAMRRLLRVT